VVASLALHGAAVLACLQFASTASISGGGSPVVHVTLLSGAGAQLADTATTQSATIASRLESLSGTFAAPAERTASTATQDSPSGSIEALVSVQTGSGTTPASVGAAKSQTIADPYARASLSGDAGLSGASELHDQVMACVMGGGASNPVTVRIELNPDGSLKRRPAIATPGARRAMRPFEAAAVRAVLECAPYKLSARPGLGVYEISIG
jgi:hypothetical protein